MGAQLVAVSIVEELLRLIVSHGDSNLPFLLLIAAVIGMSASIVTHDAALFADVAKIVRLVSAHLEASGVVCSELVGSALV